MSKQAVAVRQRERELGCLWQMETIRVSLFHVFCGRNFSMLLSNRGKRCQRARDEVTTIFIKLPVYISSLFYENMHSNGLGDPGGKAVADSLSTWHSELFYSGGGGGGVTRAWPNSSKAWLGTHVCLGCERLNPGWGGQMEFVTKRTLIAPIFFLA